MTWPTPTRKDHDTFCRVEEWRQMRDARGRAGTHHVTYEFGLSDGRILRTRISHPVDRTDYGPGLWRHILRDQLEVDDATFWRCARDGVKPERGVPALSPAAIPADVVHLLISRVGLAEKDIMAMTRDEAVDTLRDYWSNQ